MFRLTLTACALVFSLTSVAVKSQTVFPDDILADSQPVSKLSNIAPTISGECDEPDCPMPKLDAEALEYGIWGTHLIPAFYGSSPFIKGSVGLSRPCNDPDCKHMSLDNQSTTNVGGSALQIAGPGKCNDPDCPKPSIAAQALDDNLWKYIWTQQNGDLFWLKAERSGVSKPCNDPDCNHIAKLDSSIADLYWWATPFLKVGECSSFDCAKAQYSWSATGEPVENMRWDDPNAALLKPISGRGPACNDPDCG